MVDVDGGAEDGAACQWQRGLAGRGVLGDGEPEVDVVDEQVGDVPDGQDGTN